MKLSYNVYIYSIYNSLDNDSFIQKKTSKWHPYEKVPPGSFHHQPPLRGDFPKADVCLVLWKATYFEDLWRLHLDCMSQLQRYEWWSKRWINATIFMQQSLCTVSIYWVEHRAYSIPLATVCRSMLLSYVLYPSNISFQFALHLSVCSPRRNAQMKVMVLRENTALRENVASLLSEAHHLYCCCKPPGGHHQSSRGVSHPKGYPP